MESILTSVKKMLGIAEEYEHFDADIIMHINSALMILTQIGVGPAEGFMIEDATSTWTDFLGNEPTMEAAKSYVHHKVRLMFDPPQSGPVIESINRTVNELEWRLNVASESAKSKSEEVLQNGE